MLERVKTEQSRASVTADLVFDVPRIKKSFSSIDQIESNKATNKNVKYFK